ncbi:MAG: hypothetical protein KJN72_12330 [Woeseia sp.]|nr:hypothetical protein [Woeseia sp.]
MTKNQMARTKEMARMLVIIGKLSDLYQDEIVKHQVAIELGYHYPLEDDFMVKIEQGILRRAHELLNDLAC